MLAAVRSSFHGIASAYTLVDLNCTRRGHAHPSGLRIEHLEQGVVVLVKQDGRAGGGAKLHRAPYVVDVGMGDDDLLDLQVMLADKRENVFNVIAGVDDHRFARGFVADDRAVALQRPDGEDFVDHTSIVAK
jgi:hypothetical protein